MSQKFRTQLCRLAKEWLGVKYEHRGTTRNGCDCTGLIIGILREMGYLKNYKLRNYSKDWNLHAGADNHIMEEVEKVSNKIENPDSGDLVLFSIGKCVAHVGLIVESDLFIHCYVKSRKCVVSRFKESEWTKRIVGFYRLDEDKLNGFCMG